MERTNVYLHSLRTSTAAQSAPPARVETWTFSFHWGESPTTCVGAVVVGVSLCKHPSKTLWAAPGQTAVPGAPSLLTGHADGAAARRAQAFACRASKSCSFPPPAMPQREEFLGLQPHHPGGLLHPAKG